MAGAANVVGLDDLLGGEPLHSIAQRSPGERDVTPSDDDIDKSDIAEALVCA
jgi:hypothetical protein